MAGGKIALITGISGQDGSYLAELLISKGYRVRGIIRRASTLNTQRIQHLVEKYGSDDDIDSPFVVRYGDMTDASTIRAIIEKFQPDEIYNLAAQSHVGISFDNAQSTININTLGVLRILEALREMKSKCKFYQASSSEMFGISPPPQNELTSMQPQSPYGISKLASFHLTKLYRNAYGLFACNGILFNHECASENTPLLTKDKKTGMLSVQRIKDIRTPRKKGTNVQQWIINGLEIWDGEKFVDLKFITATRRKKDKDDFNCKTINTRHGVIETTNHHNLISQDNEKVKARKIQLGDKLLHHEFPSYPDLSVLSKEEALFLGMMVGDGYASEDGRANFANNDPKVMDIIKSLWLKIGLGGLTIRSYKTEYGTTTRAILNGNSTYLKYLRDQIYTFDGYKKVPDRVLNSSKEIKLAFLIGYNITDGLKSAPTKYTFKNFKTDSVVLAQGLLYLVSQTTKQDFNITFEHDPKYYGYYSINFLSPTNNQDKQDKVGELIASGLSQRAIQRETGISRTFIRNIQHGGIAQLVHHLSKDKQEVKKAFYHRKQPEWVFDLETESGKFMAGVGNIVIANSPRRGYNFVTKKITQDIASILTGEKNKIVLGNLDAKRDWGFSGDYVEAMWKIMQHHTPDDFVIATGETHTVREFLQEAFSLVGLDYTKYLEVSDRFKRPAEVPALLGDATKAKTVLKWEPKVKFKELAHMMLDAELKEKLERKGIVPIEPGVERKKGYYIEKGKELARKLN